MADQWTLRPTRLLVFGVLVLFYSGFEEFYGFPRAARARDPKPLTALLVVGNEEFFELR